MGQPSLILQSMVKYAKTYSVTDQLDVALGRAVALTFGPLLPVDAPEINIRYIASSCFFELGLVPEPMTRLPPVSVRPLNYGSLTADAVVKRKGPEDAGTDESVKRQAEKDEADFGMLSALLRETSNDPGRRLSIFQLLASATWMAFANGCRAIGLNWEVFRSWLSSSTAVFDETKIIV